MRHRIPSIFSSLLLCSLLMGCSSLKSPPKETSVPPLERVFADSYDNVWKAIQFALKNYPMKVSDSETGVFETQDIRGDKTWVSPGSSRPTSGGQRYTVSVKLIKGRDANQNSNTKVIILKRAEIQRDFFSEPERLPSDGLEEYALMYRIERELDLARILAKVKK